MLYEAVWYNGWVEPPAYYLIEQVEGDSPEEALRDKLTELTQKVRKLFGLDQDVSDRWIQDALYIVRADGLVPVRRVVESAAG